MTVETMAETTPATVAEAAYIDHPSGFFSLSERNQRFTAEGVEGFIAYREQGKHWVLFGGVNAHPDQQGPLLDAFIEAARQKRRHFVAVQVREHQIDLFRKRGATVNQLGASFAITLADYTYVGTKKMKLRNKIKRARKAGCTVVEIGRDIPRDEAAFDQVRKISELWLKDLGHKELDFMIGEIGGTDDQLRRVFLVRDKEDQPVAFITYVPSWGSRSGFLHDLTRKVPRAPTGAMELCNSFAMDRMKEEGIGYLHFGFTPFIVEGEEPEGHSPFMAWLVRKLLTHGKAIYPAESQAKYKTKWGTDVIDREYIAAKPLSLRAAWDLMRLTRSL